MLTVRLDSTTFWPGGNCGGSTHAGVPDGIGGTTKLTWYSPTYPGVAPANTGFGADGSGLVASAFGRKLKSSPKVVCVGAAAVTSFPVPNGGVGCPSPTACALNPSPALARFL